MKKLISSWQDKYHANVLSIVFPIVAIVFQRKVDYCEPERLPLIHIQD